MATKKAKRPRHYWLFKSEPDVYSIDQLAQDGRTYWNGVRNYQARNLLRDDIQEGDEVLYYHSRVQPIGVAGTARVSSAPCISCTVACTCSATTTTTTRNARACATRSRR